MGLLRRQERPAAGVLPDYDALAAGDRLIVFDPFCGSGTTAVAAKELNHSFVGAELEKEYAELAARRVGAAERGGMLEAVRGAGVLPGG